MTTTLETSVRDQLVDRRRRLAAAGAPRAADVRGLIGEIDAALARLDAGGFGACAVCDEPVEFDRLSSDPLVRVCLGCLTAAEREAHERDLQTASAVQAALLPPRALEADGWDIALDYRPRGAVSGDHVDLMRLPGAPGGVFVAVGDVAGKGVAASLLMAHLHALVRSLVALELPLEELLARANRQLVQSTLPEAYASLAVGQLGADGRVAIGNAGHPPPLLVGARGRRTFPATGVPAGLFAGSRYGVTPAHLAPGDVLAVFTDGLSEAANGRGDEYGPERLARVLRARRGAPAAALVAAVRHDLEDFRAGAPPGDDLTLVVIRRVG